MKKIVLFLAAVTLLQVAGAQFVMGLQGGYYNLKQTNSHNDDFQSTTSWLGGAQLGYMITPKWYVGVAGGYLSNSYDSVMVSDYMYVNDPNSAHRPMWMNVEDHRFNRVRTGFWVAPQVKYEVVKYGNMHFHILLQGNFQKMGYTVEHERYIKPFENNRELADLDKVADSIGSMTWGVSLRPTLSYDFSSHLSAELSLDFLSIGYVSQTVSDDHIIHQYDSHGILVPDGDYKMSYTKTTMYAGLNTLMELLKWESPMLRLGFNYTF